MIQVYLDSTNTATKAARLGGAIVDFRWNQLKNAPDRAATHREIRDRFDSGEGIQENAFPNQAFPAPEVISPKRWSKQAILAIESCPPYYIGRGIEEAISIQPQAQQDALYIRVKKIMALKTDLRAVVTADPPAWADGEQQALQTRIDEVVGWSA